MTTAKSVKARFGKLIKLAEGDNTGINGMEYKTKGKGENPGEDVVSKENSNTGERSNPPLTNQTSGSREHQYSVEEQNANQRQR